MKWARSFDRLRLDAKPEDAEHLLRALCCTWIDAYTTLGCVRVERYASPSPRAQCQACLHHKVCTIRCQWLHMKVSKKCMSRIWELREGRAQVQHVPPQEHGSGDASIPDPGQHRPTTPKLGRDLASLAASNRLHALT